MTRAFKLWSCKALTVKTLLLLALTLLSGVAAHAQTNIFDSRVFNWRFYLFANADLLRAGFKTEAASKNHWQNNGLNEGRQAHPQFHTRQYLDLYSDVRTTYGATNYSAALSHYLSQGISGGRRGYIDDGAYGRWAVRSNISGNIVSLSASTRQAGAIDSVMWKGKEFINSWDHGRQLQYAIYTNQGELYNPTEAGSCADGLSSTSSSVLEAISASDSSRTIASQGLPAFWRSPSPATGTCGDGVNTTVVSNYRTNKSVQAGYAGLPHAIRFLTTVRIPENVPSGGIEAPTAYMNGEFTKVITYDPATQVATPLAVPAAANGNTQAQIAAAVEQNKPLIFSTPDDAYAMGCWSPDLPQGIYPDRGYIAFNLVDSSNPINSSTKWTAIYRWNALPAGTVLNFRTYIAVGSTANVKTTLSQLYQKWQAGTL